MVTSAMRLLSERGAHGLTIDAVLADSGAPRGSVYYHFPGGRAELLTEAARTSSTFITEMIRGLSAGGDPARTLDSFVRFWRGVLVDSDFHSGCPVAAVIAGEDVPADVSEMARTAFATWAEEITKALVDAGIERTDAEQKATLAVAAVEGAVTLCRAHRSTTPLDHVGAQLQLFLEVSR